MNKISSTLTVISMSLLLCVTACTDNNASTPTPASQKRINQTRSFNAPNQNVLLQAVLATLQDQGYNIVRANSNNAEITAQRDGDIIISVIVYPTGKQQFSVRANAQHFVGNNGFFSNNQTGYEVIMDPVFYQKEFFDPLSKSLFLQKENLSN